MKLKPEKNPGLNGIQTYDLCTVAEVMDPNSFQAWMRVFRYIVSVSQGKKPKLCITLHSRQLGTLGKWRNYTSAVRVFNISLKKAMETLACGSCSHSISRSPKLSQVFL